MGIIFLTGMTGSGKTVVGAELAAQLGVPFVDLDAEIASAAGRNISRIFEEDGEAYFRELESEALRRVLSKTRGAVIALGAGALEVEDNLNATKISGTLVYLKADLDTLVARLADGSNRPLLAGAASPHEIRRRLAQMLERREVGYLSAHIALDASAGRTPAEIAEAIAERLTEK